ncbi:MAG TPA: DNA repair protein RecO [Bacilli bacterium]
MLKRVEGLVIRTNDYGEGHKILTLYTCDAGKTSVMARGAKKLNSRFAAAAQLFTYGEYAFYKSGQIGTLQSAEILDSHHLLREDLEKTAYSAYIAELVDRLADEEPNAGLFGQLLAALRAIEEGKDPQITTHVMEMKLMALAGYAPVLDRCANCGKDIGGSAMFSAAAGGVLCAACANAHAQAMPLADSVWKLLRLLNRVDLRRIGTISVKPETKRVLKQVLRRYMDGHVEVSRWKARSFLDQMSKYEL